MNNRTVAQCSEACLLGVGKGLGKAQLCEGGCQGRVLGGVEAPCTAGWAQGLEPVQAAGRFTPLLGRSWWLGVFAELVVWQCSFGGACPHHSSPHSTLMTCTGCVSYDQHNTLWRGWVGQ